jgi:hypothetical protein
MVWGIKAAAVPAFQQFCGNSCKRGRRGTDLATASQQFLGTRRA